MRQFPLRFLSRLLQGMPPSRPNLRVARVEPQCITVVPDGEFALPGLASALGASKRGQPLASTDEACQAFPPPASSGRRQQQIELRRNRNYRLEPARR